MKVQILALKKHYGRTRAVDGISFHFEGGQIFGFVGPNGAGKSTTMRILATLEEPTDGDCTIDGLSVTEEPEKTHRLVGYVPDQEPSHRDITVHDYLDFFARAYGVKNPKRDQMVQSIEEFTNLTGIRDKFLNALSKGMRNRVSLARALVHDPPVLIMDEPASGLDPRARIELRDLLRELAGQGKAILISSHILTELAEICTGAVIIERGKMLRAGTLEQILNQDSPHKTILVRTLDRAKELHQRLLELPNINNVKAGEKGIEVEFTGDDQAGAELLAALVKEGFPIIEYRPQRADLEDIFMNVTRGEVQ
jgi:ABC-2 type transport system ATP-binding protein